MCKKLTTVTHCGIFDAEVDVVVNITINAIFLMIFLYIQLILLNI